MIKITKKFRDQKENLCSCYPAVHKQGWPCLEPLLISCVTNTAEKLRGYQPLQLRLAFFRQYILPREKWFSRKITLHSCSLALERQWVTEGGQTMSSISEQWHPWSYSAALLKRADWWGFQAEQSYWSLKGRGWGKNVETSFNIYYQQWYILYRN